MYFAIMLYNRRVQDAFVLKTQIGFSEYNTFFFYGCHLGCIAGFVIPVFPFVLFVLPFLFQRLCGKCFI